jgi:hypothetical protein
VFYIAKSLNKDALAVAVLLGMVVWFCDEIAFAAKIPFFRDLVTYFYPIKFSVAEAFKAGELPLWDRHMATGFPIMAGFQSAVFYPPSAAYYVLTFFPAIRFTFIFHYALAATGSYVLFRSWKLSVHVSLIGAILFTFGGTAVSLSNLLNHFQSAVWLPWVIYFWERAVRTAGWKNISIFSIVALCQLLAGSPEIFLLSIGLVALDTFRLACDERLRGIFEILAISLGSACIVVGLGMLQLLPTAELVMQSRRDQAIHMAEALSWSLQPSSLIGLLLPTLEADASLTAGIRLLFAHGVPFLLSHYIGVIGILGLSGWFRAASMKERAVVLAALGGSLLFAFGSYTPVYPFLYDWVPMLRVMRFPEKYYYLSFAVLVVTVVRGLRSIDENKNSHAWWAIATAISAAWLIAYVTFRIRPQLLAEFFLPRISGATSLETDPRTIAAILVILEKQIAISVTFALVFGLSRLSVLRPALAGALLVLAVFFDLSSATKPLHFLRDENSVQSAARILEKPPADHSRLFYYPPGNNVHPSFMRVAGNPTYEKATELAMNNLLPNAGTLYGFGYFQDIDALGRRGYTDFLMFINSLPAERRGKLLRAVNVKYVVAFHTLEVKGLELVREFPEHYSALYQVADAVPRAYVARHAIFDPNGKTTLERMASDDFDPLRDVILDAPVQLEPKASFQGSATINRYENNRVLVDARLSDSAVLVLTDAFYPGWKVFVDGKEQTIRRANYLFRGVELPAGAHQVEFVYDPLSFKIGLIVSLLTGVFLIAVPLASAIRRRRLLRQSARIVSHQPARAPLS